jgi:hypothetical protein
MAALVEKDTTAKQIYGPDVTWDIFCKSQSQWVATLLLLSDDVYSNLWELVHDLEKHGHLLIILI